ncbi:MAG: amino acid ABC transporter permease [Verrucomicrobiota bacterium]
MRTPLWRHWAATVLVTVFVSFACFVIFTKLDARWEVAWENRTLFFRGWLTTLMISIAALLLSVVFGVLLLAGRKSPYLALRWFCTAYVEFIRSSPLLVQLIIGYNLFLPAFGIDDRFASGVLILSSFCGAYLSEIFRGGIESVSASQREAARAVGFDRWQTYRYVIIPQAVRRVLPAVTGQFANLIKDSSLLSVIGLTEFTRQGQSIAAQFAAGYSVFIPIAVGYLILTLPLSAIAAWLERRFRFES